MNRDHFVIDEKGFTNVYIGGYTLNPGTPTKTNGTAIYYGPKNPNNLSFSSRKNRVENNGAVRPIKKAVKWDVVEKLRLNTSSSVLYDGITEWLPKWEAANWVNEFDGKKNQNRSSWKQLNYAIRKLQKEKVIEFNYIAPDSGIVHQNVADNMAKTVAESR